MNKTLAIVLPTKRYNTYLDDAIQSCLDVNYQEKKIYVNINSKSDSFKKSRFWNNKFVSWRYIDDVTDKMYISFNDAVSNSEGDWIFMMSDDDIIHRNLLNEVDLGSTNESDLIATRINYINGDGRFLYNQKPYSKELFKKDDFLDLFFDQKVINHISTFVFSRNLFNKVGGYTECGYPNGLFMDTIFHAKLLANSQMIYCSTAVNFSRRLSKNQGSYRFYIDQEVNNFIDIIVENMLNDIELKIQISKRFRSVKNFKRKMLIDRFKTELWKLNMYKKNQFKFFINFLIFWNTGVVFKAVSFLYVIFFLIFFRVTDKRIELK
jgi:glycosyltransferase involved in cell wall biosynthesis